MFLERLVAIGDIFQKHGLDVAEKLRLLADVQEAPRFLANIVVLELFLNGSGFRAASLPLQTWGEYQTEMPKGKRRKKPRHSFLPDFSRGLALPFARPAVVIPGTPRGNMVFLFTPSTPTIRTGLHWRGIVNGRL